MSNPIFDAYKQQQAQAPQQMNMQSALAQLKANPTAVLQNAGYSFPKGMTDPQQIVQHLLQSGQVPQNRFNQVMQMVGMRR